MKDLVFEKFDIIEKEILLKYFKDENEREEYLKFKRFMMVLDIENSMKNKAIKEFYNEERN